MDTDPLSSDTLPAGIRTRHIDHVNGLRMHVLEAGENDPARPCLLLLHGFPELAYSWRKVMLPLAEAGYYVIAPDQRGYGWTTGADKAYGTDLRYYGMPNLVTDMLCLLRAVGRSSVDAVIGHDFGSPVAAWAALCRPDVFRSVVMMSAPFGGPPGLPPADGATAPDIHAAMAALSRPRKHYQWYYSTPDANADMTQSPEGMKAFLRAYYHHKSADWAENKPFRLTGWTATELEKMPTYYIMDLNQTMPETVAPHMPTEAEIAACEWLPDDELDVYTNAYERTGFQAQLHWYRARTTGHSDPAMQIFSGRTIDVPSLFVAGASDWGIQQMPGHLEAMQETACTRMLGCHLVDGAGHWVQQEQPNAVLAHLFDFLDDPRRNTD